MKKTIILTILLIALASSLQLTHEQNGSSQPACCNSPDRTVFCIGCTGPPISPPPPVNITCDKSITTCKNCLSLCEAQRISNCCGWCKARTSASKC